MRTPDELKDGPGAVESSAPGREGKKVAMSAAELMRFVGMSSSRQTIHL